MQRAPGESRMYRVAYGDGEIEFMLQPWFALEVGTAASGATPHDIVVTGVGRPDDADLGRALRAASVLAPAVREGGAMVIAAQLDDVVDEDDAPPAAPELTHGGRLAIVAASEAPELARLAGLRAAVDVEEALDIAYEHIGRPERASVLLVPRALHTLPVVQEPVRT